MLGGSLKDWLLQDPEHQWGLQVMLDTLALGENIPARLISLTHLENLYDILENLHRNAQTNTFSSHFPTPKEFDDWVTAELTYLNQKIHCLPATEHSHNGYTPTDEIIQEISKHIFVTLTSNELPIENQLRVELPQWEWLQVLCLYLRLKTQYSTSSKVFCIQQLQVETVALDVNICRQQEGIESPCEQLGLMIGPLISTKEAFFAEEAYDKHVVEPIIEALRAIFTHYKNRNNFSFTRIHKAIQAEPAIPRISVERRAHRLSQALQYLLAFQLQTSQQTDAQCLRMMSFWCLVTVQRRELILDYAKPRNEKLVFYMKYTADTLHNARAPNLILLTEFNCQNLYFYLQEEKNIHWLLCKENYGSDLSVSPLNQDTNKALELFALKLGNTFIRIDQKTRLLDQKRLLIFTEWLQGRIGSLISQDGTHVSQELYMRSSEQICRWIAESVRSDLCMLFTYEESNGANGKLIPINSYSRTIVSDKCRQLMGRDMEDIADSPENRSASISYRAVDSGKQKVCYSYESKKKVSIPLGETLYRSNQTTEYNPPYKTVISTPIKFNGHLLGIIEVSSSQAWRLRYNNQISLKRIASTIAPFLYQHKHLQALHETQMAILDFHAGNIEEYALYNTVCQSMSQLFLCKGTALWIRDSIDKKLFTLKGSHNIRSYSDRHHIDDEYFLSGKLIQEYEQSLTCDIREIKHVDLRSKEYSQSMRHKNLTQQNIQSLNILPIIFQRSDKPKITATLSIYDTKEDKYDESWTGIGQFISSYLSFIIEAANAFIAERRSKESLHAHELWHDASYLADKAQKIAKGHETLRKKIEAVQNFVESPWFKKQLEIGRIMGAIDQEKIDSIAGKTQINEQHYKLLQNINSTKHELDSELFLPQKDMITFISMIKTRIKALHDSNTGKDDKDYKRILARSGNKEVADFLALSKDVMVVDIRSLYLSITEGNEESKSKGLFLDFELSARNKAPRTSPTLIKTILSNLLANAVKYSHQHTHITTRLEYEDIGILSLKIINFGTPMQPYEHEEVLACGIRGSNSKGQVGYGMGLYIVDQICKHILNIEFSFTEKNINKSRSKYVSELVFQPSKVMNYE